VYWGEPNDAVTLNGFILKVNPIGFWPDRSFKQSLKELSIRLLQWFFICFGLILWLVSFHKFIFMGAFFYSILLFLPGASLIYLAIFGVAKLKNVCVSHPVDVQ
jgi:vacuolar-type H+-ATPase subunit I/STV1